MSNQSSPNLGKVEVKELRNEIEELKNDIEELKNEICVNSSFTIFCHLPSCWTKRNILNTIIEKSNVKPQKKKNYISKKNNKRKNSSNNYSEEEDEDDLDEKVDYWPEEPESFSESKEVKPLATAGKATDFAEEPDLQKGTSLDASGDMRVIDILTKKDHIVICAACFLREIDFSDPKKIGMNKIIHLRPQRKHFESKDCAFFGKATEDNWEKCLVDFDISNSFVKDAEGKFIFDEKINDLDKDYRIFLYQCSLLRFSRATMTKDQLDKSVKRFGKTKDLIASYIAHPMKPKAFAERKIKSFVRPMTRMEPTEPQWDDIYDSMYAYTKRHPSFRRWKQDLVPIP